MFTLRVRYLTGRVCAAEFDEGDAKATVEWPPHPSRLFSALVASWAEGGGEPELRAALEWLEKQRPPAIYAGSQHPRQLVNVFVPVNDDSMPPEERTRKGRTFPSASLEEPEAWFVWPEALPAGLDGAMNELLRRTPSMGHSSSIVSVERDGSPPEALERYELSEHGEARMRVPSPGRLAALERSYARFREDPSKVHRPSRGATALYARGGAAKPEAARGVFGEMAILRRVKGEALFLGSTLAVTAALRGALMKLGPQPPLEMISGHAPESAPGSPVRSARPHIALVPLAFAGPRYADGSIKGVAVLLPREIGEEERDTVLGTLRKVQELPMGFAKWNVGPADDEAMEALQAHTWTQPSRCWATVTPYVFDRYPGDPFGEEAQETVRASFERAGFPRPVEVAINKVAWHIGVPPAGRFPAAPGRTGKPSRFHIHVRVEFDRPVAGPVVAGAGRFYGYGLFRRVEERNGSER